mmetsp:Transcript_35489/g.101332  ORF Transcript_35489/g.101332 Transcript_35489/m.101332 type:complete len:637 (+) Transcript_35489:38-1948(+)|eukprot:CAMPEP_0168368612 /NCGR_PEP_ID=MMETSP0228-20121227/6340_1 /TAXON_ID=133427 /ORGANISM="Protoceratium reticulatum, Strain CCCM 535 (=CCMP 1889)" /LENGTH=636 /DNA_ID=CAMNT_0008381463 /DNA_START=32 /DNA_END=1942 /DNA_ORIENTATION=+
MSREIKGGEAYGHERHVALPGHKPHRCTDIGWLVLLCLGLAFLGYIEYYAYQHGDARKLTRAFDFNGQMCGVGNSAGQYAFWCKDHTFKTLMIEYPVCVKECPAGNDTSTMCFNQGFQSLTAIPNYPTRPLMNMCVPKERRLKTTLMQELVGKDVLAKMLTVLSDIRQAWMLIAGAGVLAILVGYVYLFLLDHCAGPLVMVCIFLEIFVPIAIGTYMVYISLVESQDSMVSTGDSQSDLIWGCSLLGVGLLVSIIACCYCRGVDTAIGCIEAACECMFQELTLTLEPFISLTIKVLTLVVMAGGFSALISCGDVESLGGGGILRTFTWTNEEYAYMAFFGFMLIWLLELSNAISQYVLAWATQMWYFTPYDGDRKEDVPSCGICKGYANAIFYHLGTLAFGSLLIGTLRCLRIVLGAITRASEAEGNCIGECIGKICQCFISCFQEGLEFVNKNAYMDVSIHSEGFCGSAVRAMWVVSDEVPAVAFLNGAQFIFQIAGMGIISLVPSLTVFLVCKRVPVFSQEDQSLYVQEPKWVSLCAGIVSAVIGLSFMIVFDTVGDTILYCFATEQMFHRHKQMQVAANGQLQPEEEDGSNYFWGMFGQGAEEVANFFMEERVVYAPPRLRKLIKDHEEMEEE